MSTIKDLSGKKFGHWEVLNFAYVDTKSGHAYWTCLCTLCGRIKAVRSDSLGRGVTSRCAKCAALEKTHGTI